MARGIFFSSLQDNKVRENAYIKSSNRVNKRGKRPSKSQELFHQSNGFLGLATRLALSFIAIRIDIYLGENVEKPEVKRWKARDKTLESQR
jgi:hypothetical protein